MATVSSGVSLSTDYFMRNFYSNNRKAIKSSDRSQYSRTELSYEDSRALSKAVKQLQKGDYGSDRDEKDSDINDTAKASIEAFVKTYNNTLDSSRNSDDADTKRYIKQLKKLSSKYADELEDIGITIENNGSLTINDELLKKADNSKVRKLLSKDSEFTRKSFQLAGRMNRAIEDDLLSQINSQGLHINIAL